MKKIITLLFVLTVAIANADVRLPGVISEHMVLQSGMPVPIWGWADAGEKVSVSFAGQTASTQAAKDGKWRVTFAPLTASAKPQVLTVKGNNTLTVGDVLVGEAWHNS